MPKCSHELAWRAIRVEFAPGIKSPYIDRHRYTGELIRNVLVDAKRCADCGAWLSIGDSNETPVSIEVRAAELYACANHCAEVQDDDCHCYRPSHLLPDPHDEAKARRLYQEMWATHSEES